MMKSQMQVVRPVDGQEMPEATSFDDYYILEFSKGELTKKVNKEKYATWKMMNILKG